MLSRSVSDQPANVIAPFGEITGRTWRFFNRASNVSIALRTSAARCCIVWRGFSLVSHGMVNPLCCCDVTFGKVTNAARAKTVTRLHAAISFIGLMLQLPEQGAANQSPCLSAHRSQRPGLPLLAQQLPQRAQVQGTLYGFPPMCGTPFGQPRSPPSRPPW